jgi:hypothetical protein
MSENSTRQQVKEITDQYQENKPEGYTGYAPSVSDVIVLRWREDVTANYVDSMGFKELSTFTGNERQPEPPAPEKSAPTVTELEANVKAGKAISLLDLANAVNSERGNILAKESPPAPVNEYEPVYYEHPDVARELGEIALYRDSMPVM